ncbi:MAG: hypothetical protein QOG42_1476, partial [Solirubrobacteraceae bacterium]|nr:hypothetical protein [Solirubrobacteraceae bacterium]
MSPESPRIFVNYRRADSAGWAGRLHDDLVARFGDDRVFRDVRIAPGEDYADRIERVMNECEVCLVLIGRTWVSVAGPDGRRRLDDPNDLLRLEIERALTREDVRVIPVLLDGTAMPAENELPDGLRKLARRNACELTDPRWADDVRRLCNSLQTAIGESTFTHERVVNPRRVREFDRPGEPTSPVSTALLATLAATVCAAVVAALASKPLVGLGTGAWGRVVGYAIERGAIWALIGAAVVAAAAATFGNVRVPVAAALAGAGGGALAGATGGAGYMVLKHFAHITEQDSYWLLVYVRTALPGLAVGAA